MPTRTSTMIESKLTPATVASTTQRSSADVSICGGSGHVLPLAHFYLLCHHPAAAALALALALVPALDAQELGSEFLHLLLGSQQKLCNHVCRCIQSPLDGEMKQFTGIVAPLGGGSCRPRRADWYSVKKL